MEPSRDRYAPTEPHQSDICLAVAVAPTKAALVPAGHRRRFGRLRGCRFAGDMDGKMWKFDLPRNSANWAVRCSTTPAGVPPHPIMGMPDAAPHPKGGLMVYFGTGTLFTKREFGNDKTLQNYVYGIWDGAPRQHRAPRPDDDPREMERSEGCSRVERQGTSTGRCTKAGVWRWTRAEHVVTPGFVHDFRFPDVLLILRSRGGTSGCCGR